MLKIQEAVKPLALKPTIKTHQLPSVVVFENSGEDCLKYNPKPVPPKPKTKRGWIA